MPTRARLPRAVMTFVLLSISTMFGAIAASACGGSERPEAPPGVPMNPPQEDPALAEMMAAMPSTTATATAAPPTASASAAASASASAAPAASASAKPAAGKPKPPAPPPQPKK